MTRKKTKNFEPDVMGTGEDDLDLMGDDLDLMGDDSSVAEERALGQIMGVFKSNEEFDRQRSAANMELIGLLAQYLTDYPTQRFGQALKNLDLATEDCALAEPRVQLNRAKAALKKMRK